MNKYFTSAMGTTQLFGVHQTMVGRRTPNSRGFLWMVHNCLLLFLGITWLLGVSYTFGWNETAWYIYNRTYLYMLLAYTWFIFILLFVDDVRKRKYPRYANEKIAVVLPCYNEDPKLLERSIRSIHKAKGTKKIYIVDDGSTNNIQPLLRKLARTYNIKLHCFPKNKGKRHALHYAVTKMITNCDIVVTIDSDTVLDKNALIRITEPLKNPKIGASTGDIQLLNENENWLTRMVGAYYWIGLNIYKKAQSSLGMVVCCSGCLAAYRYKELRQIIGPFVRQRFMGEQCTHSEDRHLTNLILQRNYEVIYTPAAIAYTETPSTLRAFLRQQQRWKRGYARESLYTLSYAWRNRPLLFLQLLLWDLTIPFFSFGMMTLVVSTIVLRPMFFATDILPAWVAFLFIRNMPLLFYARHKIKGLLLYMVMYEVFLYWQSILGLLTVSNKSWMTRQPVTTN